MKRSLALSALVALTLTACNATTSSTDTIKIGFLGPLTGAAAGLGNDMLNGARLAVQQINDAGGINGKKLELVAEDGKCAGGDAATAAQKLVNVDQVVAIVGGGCSGETLAAAPIAEAGKVVMISPVSSSPDVTKAGAFIFRNYPSDALKTVTMAKYFKEKGIAKVAMITENTDFSQGFRTALKADLPADAAVFDEVVEPGTKDFRTLMTRLKDVEFDVFFPNGNSDAVIGPMLQQFREAGFTQVAISHDAADSVTMAKDLPEATEGFYVINVSSDVTDPSFSQTLTAAYGEAQYGVVFSAYAYDVVQVFAKAFTAGVEKGDALKEWLLAMPEHEGKVGTFSFDENGDVVGIPYVLKQYRDGTIVKVQNLPM